MPDLIAQGERAYQRWRRSVARDEVIVLGRSSAFAADWDDRISRRHAELRWNGTALEVTRVPSARNSILYHGQATDQFEMRLDEHFVIGQTTFTLVEHPVNVSLTAPAPSHEQSFAPEFLRQMEFRNARARIDVLARLPEVISGATSEVELQLRLINLLMAGIPHADAVALVRISNPRREAGPIEVLHWDRRRLSDLPFQPSERLIRDAIAKGESMLHVWQQKGDARFTSAENVDWSFCTPILGNVSRGWAIYVSGRFAHIAGALSPSSENADLRDDLKFTEVAAATFRSLQELRSLERRQAVQSQFFSPAVLGALSGEEDPDNALVPRETEVTVLFCDLRGFSRESEKAADDLLGLLDRVSKALGVTTHEIFQQGGVVGDFQGDAAMGFWGWPLAQEDSVERACRAALAIRKELENAARRHDDALAGFSLGIGVATGRAVAGKIGTVDQAKVTVFGPVVNLASRLEGMTKLLRAPILLDERTATIARQKMHGSIARFRRVAKVRPYGLGIPLEVTELLPPTDQHPVLSDQQIDFYESALNAFNEGRWDIAFERLHRVPAEDRTKDFLTVMIAQHNREAPDDWEGIVELKSK